MAFSVLSIVVRLALAFFAYKLVSFARLYIHARRAGFPVYVSPVLSKSIPWLVLAPPLVPQLEKYLPRWIYDRLDVVTHGWEFRRKRELHDRFGNTFTVVTPDECTMWVADPAAGHAILQRRNDFLQAPIAAKFLGFLGPNVFAANGDEWKRHRRMFAANLDERISRTVWTETCQQARSMLDYVASHPGGETLDGLRSIAINVIGQAGYNQEQPWSPNLRKSTSEAKGGGGGGGGGGRGAYFTMLSLATDMLAEAAVLPPWLMKLPFMPRPLQVLGQHLQHAPQYVHQVLEDERLAAASQSGRRNSFLSLLLQLSDEEKRSGTGFSLTEHEISGSLFIFSTAGFETTANTMGYTVTMLAALPEWQHWLHEELNHLDADASTWKYEEVYPKCRRTLALMFETLRLFSPVLHSTRAVLEPQQLASSDGTHLLAPPMDVFVSASSIHLDPSIWGPDAMEFKPSRWIDESGQLITPAKGTFIPWSTGPRICPGMKMAQVEFVATMATLFRSARCEPLPTAGLHEPGHLRQRLQTLVQNSVPKLTLQVRDPKAVQLRWVRE